MTPSRKPKDLEPSVDTIRIPAIEVTQLNSRCIVTKMSVAHLSRYTTVEGYDSSLGDTDENQGYQRPLNDARSKLIEQYMVDEVKRTGVARMPGTILCSARDAKIEVRDGFVDIYPFHRFYIVDGQHRAKAYSLALANKSIDNIESYEIPVVIMIGISKLEEMRQFDKINSMQKAVDGSLTAQLLAIVEANGGVLSPKEEKKAVLAAVVRRMNEEDGSPFYHRIAMPDARRAMLGRITKAKTLQDSLQQIDALLFNPKLDHGISVTKRADSVFQVVNSIWQALSEIPQLRDVFINSESYALQQAGGVSIIHLLSSQLMHKYLSPADYKSKALWMNLFARSQNLINPEFWDKGTPTNGILVGRGRAAAATGNGGFIEMVHLIAAEINPEGFFSLPEQAVEPDIESNILTVVMNSELDDVYTVDLTEEPVNEIDIIPDISVDRTPDASSGDVPSDALGDNPPDVNDSVDPAINSDDIHIHPAVHDESQGNILLLEEKTQMNRTKRRR